MQIMHQAQMHEAEDQIGLHQKGFIVNGEIKSEDNYWHGGFKNRMLM